MLLLFLLSRTLHGVLSCYVAVGSLQEDNAGVTYPALRQSLRHIGPQHAVEEEGRWTSRCCQERHGSRLISAPLEPFHIACAHCEWSVGHSPFTSSISICARAVHMAATIVFTRVLPPLPQRRQTPQCSHFGSHASSSFILVSLGPVSRLSCRRTIIAAKTTNWERQQRRPAQPHDRSSFHVQHRSRRGGRFVVWLRQALIYI